MFLIYIFLSNTTTKEFFLQICSVPTIPIKLQKLSLRYQTNEKVISPGRIVNFLYLKYQQNKTHSIQFSNSRRPTLNGNNQIRLDSAVCDVKTHLLLSVVLVHLQKTVITKFHSLLKKNIIKNRMKRFKR